MFCNFCEKFKNSDKNLLKLGMATSQRYRVKNFVEIALTRTVFDISILCFAILANNSKIHNFLHFW